MRGRRGFVGRLYGAALVLLPAAIRHKHGAAMEELFAREIERAAGRGRTAVLLAVGAGLWDVLRRSVYERRRGPAGPGRTGRGPAPDGDGLGSRILHDVRFAARSLRRSPRFTALAVLTLALGIGANVALFTVVHGVVLRPLPFPQQESVVHPAWDRGNLRPVVPAYKLAFFRERSRAFDAMTTWWATTFETGDADAAAPLPGLRVGEGFLEVTGFQPALGRGFGPDDHTPGAPDVALLGQDAWRARWGADPGVVGRTITLDGAPHTVVGVLPPDYAFPHAPERDGALVPLRLEPDPLDESENWPMLARLAEGVEPEAARADLERVSRAFAVEHPELMNETDRGMVLASYQELYVGGVADVLWALMAATVMVLLISCANVAALLMARGSSRKGELAVRAALGAGRGRVVSQILAESLLLAVAATAAGLGLARVAVDALLGLYPGRLPRSEWIGLDATVVGYAVAAALVTGVAFGLVAALPVLRGGVASALRESTRGGTGRAGLRRVVLATEAAVSVVLLVGAGLLVATLAEIRAVDPGFAVEGLLAAPLPEPSGGWEAQGGPGAVQERVLREVRALPGVAGAAAASTYPLRRGMNIPVGIQGLPEVYEGAVEWRSVTPGYLETLGTPLVAGRAFTDADGPGAPPVALVNRAFAERYFPGESAIGKRVEIGRYRDRYIAPGLDVGGTEIVGVVADVRESALTLTPKRMVLVPAAQAPEMLAAPPVLLVRVSGGDAAVERSVRGVLQGVTGAAGAPELRRMEDVVADSLAAERFNALLMTTFAAVALLLTAFGIYGVVSYGVRQRSREIGIRMALGARRAEVTRLVMGQGMLPVLLGLGLGAVAAAGLARYLESLLWGVEPTDPGTFAAVAVLLAGVAALASWLPVREATAIDPNRSLRPE